MKKRELGITAIGFVVGILLFSDTAYALLLSHNYLARSFGGSNILYEERSREVARKKAPFAVEFVIQREPPRMVSRCSGSWLGTEGGMIYILTASHCVIKADDPYEFSTKDVTILSVTDVYGNMFANGNGVAHFPPTRVGVTKTNGNDLALLEINGNGAPRNAAGNTITSPTLYDGKSEVFRHFDKRTARTVFLVGASGLYETVGGHNETAIARGYHRIYADRTYIASVGKSGDELRLPFDPTGSDPNAVSRSTPGDGGGPVIGHIDRANYFIVGVISRHNPIKKTTNGVHEQITAAVRVSKNIDWIRSVYDNVDVYHDPRNPRHRELRSAVELLDGPSTQYNWWYDGGIGAYWSYDENGDIQCASNNGKDCLWGDQNLTNALNSTNPLSCRGGYDNQIHDGIQWCKFLAKKYGDRYGTKWKTGKRVVPGGYPFTLVDIYWSLAPDGNVQCAAKDGSCFSLSFEDAYHAESFQKCGDGDYTRNLSWCHRFRTKKAINHFKWERDIGLANSGFRDIYWSYSANGDIQCPSDDAVNCLHTNDVDVARAAPHTVVCSDYNTEGTFCNAIAGKHGDGQGRIWRRTDGVPLYWSLDTNGDVQCASDDGRNCQWWAPDLNNAMNCANPLSCGDEHTQEYGHDGYSEKGSWCNSLREHRRLVSDGG